MPEKASPRIHAAVAALGVRGSERILEVGCGHGVALSLLAERLDSGLVTGIDHSAKMAEAAAARNREQIESGRVRVERARFERFGPGGARFERIFAINVAPFWRPAEAPDFLARARVLLAPGGELSVFNQPPSWRSGVAEEFAAAFRATIADAGWEATRTMIEEMPPAAMVGVAVRQISQGG